MSWQEDLHRYMEVRAEIAHVEDKGCTCDPDNFHSCENCKEVAELAMEMHRLRDLWGDLWAVKLWRVSQGMEPATPIHFDKEAACTTQK